MIATDPCVGLIKDVGVIADEPFEGHAILVVAVTIRR
jgi:hypothetical protein